MKVLAIETASRQMGVAVMKDGEPIASYELLADFPHAVELPGAVTRVLQAAGLTLTELDAVIVDIGPGSFTGLRIGLSFVKALVYRSKTAVVGVPSLDVLAANLTASAIPVCPVIDAKQRNVYTVRYLPGRDGLAKDGEYRLGPPAEVIPTSKEPVLFLGDGCKVFREVILQRCPQAQFAAPDLWLPRAATLARLGLERLAAGQKDDPATIVPLYLYPRDCQIRGPNRPTSLLPKIPQSA